MYFKKCKI